MSSTSPDKIPRAGERGEGSVRRTSEHDEVSTLETHLGYWLRAVSNHVSHAFKAKVERQDVTVAEWVVLRALFDGDGIKPSELAVKLGLTRGAISKLVDRLVAKELVSVRSDVRDGRAQRLTLRASGRRLVPKLAALADENDAECFGQLNPEQRAFLLATLKGLVEHLGLQGAPVD
ncbi:MarR family transcriptional regulator [Myxococcus sp. K38C18041901]|uniref:MarR family winged helix-turn-helix transcriptional regulator n=1 Tax=Myxococcus guangdongensis TaxID=2906760 RepID=UPI0020A7B569|nr:MarR family transcriptional regulator [Myxococcus guangdongensis]MCP3059069.1 MarR family transcriptional regulator [Myxococcus guangdongensis]